MWAWFTRIHKINFFGGLSVATSVFIFEYLSSAYIQHTGQYEIYFLLVGAEEYLEMLGISLLLMFAWYCFQITLLRYWKAAVRF